MLKALPLPLIPPATVLVSWMLLATEEIGHIIEEPFGIHDDRPKILPLQRYCDIVGRDLHEQNNLIELARRAKRGGGNSGGDRDGPPGKAEGESH